MRLFDWLKAPEDKSWLKETLAYHERANRHSNALDPNNFLHFAEQRSEALSVMEHEVEKPTAQEKRYAGSNPTLSPVFERVNKRKRKIKHWNFVKETRYNAARTGCETSTSDSGSAQITRVRMSDNELDRHRRGLEAFSTGA